MPPKGGSSSKGLEAEEILQAVVLADRFDDRFKPLTVDRPRVSEYSIFQVSVTYLDKP
jgi:translation initiation factor eIF-2B subunit epsilon